MTKIEYLSMSAIGEIVMSSILKPFIALYTAVLFLMMSLGLLTTFVSLKLTMEGVLSSHGMG